MKRIALVSALILMCAMSIELNAQSTSTLHVFPQIADGLLPDGSSYYSSFVAANVGASTATCTIRLYGAVVAKKPP
jgi:hypothetical protein